METIHKLVCLSWGTKSRRQLTVFGTKSRGGTTFAFMFSLRLSRFSVDGNRMLGLFSWSLFVVQAMYYSAFCFLVSLSKGASQYFLGESCFQSRNCDRLLWLNGGMPGILISKLQTAVKVLNWITSVTWGVHLYLFPNLNCLLELLWEKYTGSSSTWGMCGFRSGNPCVGKC